MTGKATKTGSNPFAALRRALADERGSLPVMLGVAMLPMLVAGGVAVDFANASNQRSRLQAAVDAAVLGGAAKPLDQRIAEAQRIFAANNMRDGSTASFQNEPDGSLSGTASEPAVSNFSGIVGRPLDRVQVRSAAMPGAAASQATGGASGSGVCVLVLDPSGAQSLLVNSGAAVSAPRCEVHVKSTASPAAIFNAGTSLDLKRFCIAGKTVIQNSTATRNLELGCATASDPFAGRYAAPATGCTVSARDYSGPVTLDPGVYCGWFNFNGVTDVTLNPGTYVIRNGGWNVAGGSFRGAGVTFYFADTSKIQFNAGMDTDLTPPASGPLKSVLFYEAPNLPVSDFIFNNAIRNRMQGLIYLPSRNTTFNADSQMANDMTTMVVNRLIWNSVTLKLEPNGDVPIDAGSGAAAGTTTSSFTAPRLVR